LETGEAAAGVHVAPPASAAALHLLTSRAGTAVLGSIVDACNSTCQIIAQLHSSNGALGGAAMQGS
jgi:hypothetical protein